MIRTIKWKDVNIRSDLYFYLFKYNINIVHFGNKIHTYYIITTSMAIASEQASYLNKKRQCVSCYI